ncbi:unnamed protein product [Polarella glacialis]|uniref:HMG box domain-containing protein n=1 Tax=Polarella glacialis TaxID=89957 RepID=A0A813GHL7_POLGL|nr:unnamed protein product [Polarella glacialis]
MSEVAKAAGVEWKGMTPAAKASYEKKATQEKAAYVKALAEFKKAGGTVAGRKSKKTKEGKEGKKVKDLNAPKKPVGGAYGVFLAAKREEIKASLPAGSAVSEVAKKAGEMWKAITGSVKAGYQAVFVEKAKAYKAASELYQKNKPAAVDAVEDEAEEAEEDEAEEAEEEEEEVQEDTRKKPAAAASASTLKRPAAAPAAAAPPPASPKKRAASPKKAPAAKRAKK